MTICTNAVIELKLGSAANPVTPLPPAESFIVLTIFSAKAQKFPVKEVPDNSKKVQIDCCF